MAASDVSDLLLRIDATTEGLRRELKKAEASVGGASTKMNKSVRSFDKRFASMATSVGRASLKIGKAVGLMSVGAVGALASIISSSVNTARELENLARVANTTPEQFQRMSFAAEQFGIEQTKLSDILKDMSDRVGDFLTTGGGPMADFFETIAPAVGVTAEQFKNLSGPDALQLYVSSLEKANLTQNEMTFFMEAIASDSTMLLPLLRDNGKAFAELGDEAERTGAIMSGDTIDALGEVDAELRKLKAGFTVVKSEIAAGALPAIQEFSKTINSKEVKEGMEVFASALVRIGTVAATALSQVSSFAKGVGEFFASMVSGVDPGDKTAVEERVAELNRLIEYFSRNVGPSGRAEVKRLQEELRMLNGVLEFHNTVQPRASEAIEDTAEAAAVATAEVRNLVQSTDQLSEVVVLATRWQGGLKVATEEVTAAVQETAEEADPFAKAWETAMERIDTAFADAWKGAFDSFSDFADGLKNAFKQLLAEMAHMAITRPILVSMGLVGGSGSAVASTGGALSTAASGGNLMSLLGGGIGAMGGSAISGIAGLGSALGLGAQTGAFLGSTGQLGFNALSGLGISGAGAGTSFLAGAGLTAGAGILGGMAGTALGGSVFDKQANSNAGAMIGGVGGAFLGGPLGSALGAAVGGFLDSAFGSEGNKRAGVGINTGTGSLETFGKGGNLGPAEEIGNALLQFSQAIGGSGSMLEIARGNKSGFQLNGEGFADAASLVDAALDDILDTAWHLAPVVKDLAKAFDGSLEATAAYATAMQGVWEMANQNPVRMAMQDMESANTSVMQAYRDQVSAISELVQNFDGSAGAAQNLNQALAQNQQFAYQLAVAIGQVSGELDSMFAGSAQSIRESVMSRPDKIELFKGQRRDLRQDLNDLDDIDAINSTAKEIDRLNSLIFQNLTPEAQKKQAEAFAGFAESTNDQAQNRLDAVLKDIETTQAKQNSDIRNGMLDAAAAQQQAADTMLTAAQQMAAAAAGFSQGGGFEVNV